MRSRGAALLFAAAGAASVGTPAVAVHCPDTAALAVEVADLRDADPALGVARGEAALRELQDAGHDCPLEEARLHGAIGSNLHIQGRNVEAAAAFAAGLALLDADADPTVLATLHRGAGLAHYERDRFDTALDHYLTALDISETAGDPLETAKTAANTGIMYLTLDSLDTAREYFERALAGFRQAGWKPGIAGTQINLGSLAARAARRAAEAGDDARARRLNEELRTRNEDALRLFTELDNRRGVAYAASNVGRALDRAGDSEQGLTFHERALAARRAIGDTHGTIDSLVTMGASLTALERYDEAASALQEAAAMLPDDNPRLRLTVLEPWVALDEARGDYASALARQREIARVSAEISEEEAGARIAEVQARYDTERQAREIEALKYDRAVVAAAVAGLLLVVVGMAAWQRTARRHARELSRAARTDELTGLANRRDIRDRIAYETRRSRRSGRPFSVALLDLDDFKAINDACGHEVGDALLVAVTRRIASLLRRQDTLARWGGDELLVLLPETAEAGAATLARKIVASTAAEPVRAGGTERTVTVTVGVSQYWPGGSLDDLIRAADEAMYRGKRAGKDQVVTDRG